MPAAGPGPVSVRFTENFARNLEELEAFLGGSPGVYGRLVERLLGDVVPSLEQFPSLGFDFLARQVRSVEARILHRRLAGLAGSRYVLRGYVMDELVLLYAVDARRRAVFFLAVRHHRQLSFDFAGHWD